MSYLSDLADTVASCLTCFQSPTLRINAHKFKILRLLGEGGFSYVYLVEDTRTGKQYALKKIRCPFGQESLRIAMREIEAYKMFKSEHIIRLVDSSVAQEADGSKVVNLVLPYFRRGNLQDRINEQAVNGTHYSEDELVELFAEICKGIRVMHRYRMPAVATRRGDSHRRSGSAAGQGDSVEQIGLLDADAAGDDGPDEEGTALAEMVPYAHRDIKPANVMINEKGRCVLVDLGSATRARVHAANRQEALQLQDAAAEHCTLPYRAPELFDVKTGADIDERVDIWSLGATIFALMYGSSPFELEAAESGASLNMAILAGQYRFPTNPEYSQALKDVVARCLTVDSAQRPDIDAVIDDVSNLRSS